LHGALVSPDPLPVDPRLRDAAAVATGATIASRGADAYREALQWLLDPISIECEAA